MASRLNQFFNDPGLGQGFSNLAAMFKPPTGAEAYAYAKAKQTQDEAARIREGYAALAGSLTPEQLALAKAAGADSYMQRVPGYSLWQQSQQPGATPASIAMSQLGAGKSYGDTAPGVEFAQRAQTERNNADNTRAVTTAMLAPIGQGAVRYVPPGVADLYKTDTVQRGGVNVSAGQKTVVPGSNGSLDPAAGASIIENKRPQSMEQARAEWAQGLPDGPLKASIFAGPVQTKEAINPNTGKVEITPLTEAIGRQPAPPTTATPKTAMAQTPDGRRTSVTFDPAAGWVDSQTRQPIPPNSTVFDIKAQDTLSGVTNPTTANQTAANNRAAEVVRMRGVLDLYENLLKNNPGSIGLPGLIRGTAQNAVQVMQDMARSFGKDVPQLNQAVTDIKQGLAKVAPEMFDPSIPEAAFLQGTLAYGIARTENPSGEVSRQAYERALERIRGGYLTNTAGALANVATARKVLEGEVQAIGALRNPGAVNLGQTPQAAAPQTGTTPGRLRYNPATGELE